MKVLLIVGIITLCISNMTVLGLIAFLILNTGIIKKSAKGCIGSNDQENNSPALSPEAEDSRRRYKEQQEAFQSMMNFNAYKAYGMKEPEEYK